MNLKTVCITEKTMGLKKAIFGLLIGELKSSKTNSVYNSFDSLTESNILNSWFTCVSKVT